MKVLNDAFIKTFANDKNDLIELLKKFSGIQEAPEVIYFYIVDDKK